MAIVKRDGKIRTLKYKDLLWKYTMCVEMLLVFNILFVVDLERVMFRHFVILIVACFHLIQDFHKVN